MIKIEYSVLTDRMPVASLELSACLMPTLDELLGGDAEDLDKKWLLDVEADIAGARWFAIASSAGHADGQSDSGVTAYVKDTKYLPKVDLIKFLEEAVRADAIRLYIDGYPRTLVYA